ncbi:MAG TPA: hypothetical protein VGN14_06620 [Candidatus Elarobacter sp.]
MICQQYYINAEYQSPAGNQPGNNNNSLFVWEGGPPIQAQNAPVGSGTASTNQQQGNVVASPAGNPFWSTDYVIGYSVGPAVSGKTATTYPNTVASAYIPGGVGGTAPIQYFGTTFGFVAHGINPSQIQFKYSFVPGTNPNANKAFIGFWGSFVNNVYGTVPTQSVQIMGPMSGGTMIMSGLQLSAGGQYTAALYTSGFPLQTGASAPTTIAAWMQFTLAAP